MYEKWFPLVDARPEEMACRCGAGRFDGISKQRASEELVRGARHLLPSAVSDRHCHACGMCWAGRTCRSRVCARPVVVLVHSYDVVAAARPVMTRCHTSMNSCFLEARRSAKTIDVRHSWP